MMDSFALQPKTLDGLERERETNTFFLQANSYTLYLIRTIYTGM